jgi:ubiquinone/menaquinone biosynthesis C-methylase UbiE
LTGGEIGATVGRMRLYRERILPRLINVACNTKETRRIRAEVCAPLAGEVLEIGFGTGLNLPHLPSTVDRLLAVDPMRRGRELAAERLEAADVDVEFVGTDGQSLDLEDASVDAALMTWTLCTIPDPVAALREVGRVLRPGGMVHFVEHGRAPDARIVKWQDRLNGVQRRVAGGCNLNRDIVVIIEEADLELASLETFYADGDPKVVGWTFQGTASPTPSLPGEPTG